MTENSSKIIAPDQCVEAIEELTERFSRNLTQYLNPAYQEDQSRIEFINPFFEALGWDIANKQGFAEQYKEVVYEESLSVSGLTKAPDYSFRIGGVRKFFLEAKKPGVNLKTDPAPAYQLRRYAWSAKLSLSILTDFAEFAVYDCRIRPDEKDKADIARVEYITFEKYLDKLDWIYGAFSKDAVLKGSFDRLIESARGKRGTSEVDTEFLKEIESWRASLAKNIALRNPKLNIHQLNDAVQKTIDRIVFLRIAEDRGIEHYQQLLGLINGVNIYKRLCQVFYQAGNKYNSGLFDFKKDKFTTEIKIDDKVLFEIIESLYYPKSPYEFSVLAAEILGNIYEQFLGKVIRLTPAHQAKVEEKPEVKKAGGVYYTPKYIVDYIVENTLGKILYVSNKSVGPPRIEKKQEEFYKGIPAYQVVLRKKMLSHIQIGGASYFVSFKSALGELPKPALRQVLENIDFDDGRKYDLLLALAMPDHIHFIITPLEEKPGVFYDLGDIMKSIKGVSARRINQLLGSSGSVWEPEIYDRVIRDEEHLEKTIEYILNNPVKAGLVDDGSKYEFILWGKSSRGSNTLVGHESSREPDTLERGSHTLVRTPQEISKIKILDPACGSGSFLLGAYQYLLDYHLKYYSRGADTLVCIQQGKIYQGAKGKWFLTTQEKKRILLNNIFGVDIDPQAVEVTKLSLLLKVLENETEETINKQLRLFKERALPDLDNNIKCGNSLIGTDFYQQQQASLFSEDQKYKINAFDWQSEFPEIFHRRGAEDAENSKNKKCTGEPAARPE